MIRKFLRDIRGNYAMMTAIATVPIMGGLALAIDYGQMSRQRQDTLNALDAAGIATAHRILAGAKDDEAKAYAKDFFETNLGSVNPSDATLTVVLPQNNTGGGTLKLTANLKYRPYFFPAFAALIGKANADGSTTLAFDAKSEIRLKNTLEVALVLDNSGSMNETGTGTGQKRITLLKAAAKQLVTTLSNQATMMKQVDKPVQFGLVPFAASVNVAPSSDAQPWMDTTGISPIHHENFDWTKMTFQNDPYKYAEFSGGVWYKRGKNWGESENQPLTRFSLYSDITAETDREAIPNTTRRVCKRLYSDGTCREYRDEPEYSYTLGPYASWQGCVEARPWPYNNNDATPTTSEPATLFVPMFAPDEAKHLWRDTNHDGIPDLNDNSFGYSNNWWADWEDTDATPRQSDMRKYFRVKPYGSSSAGSGYGPNFSCTTNAITPLQDVTILAGKQKIIDAIDAMVPNGNTNVPEGTAWGWRVVSSGEPFTEGRKETERGNDKVVIVLTDGANTYGDLGSTDSANNKSTYAAYGYTGLGYNRTGTTRLFMDTSSNVGKSNYSSSNYTRALDEQMQKLCTNAKTTGIIVMTVSLDLSLSDTAEKKAIQALEACASESRFRKNADGTPKKLYFNATGSDLAEKFKEIADELSNLRIVG
jgi:Flp pilus assembly protein TadG